MVKYIEELIQATEGKTLEYKLDISPKSETFLKTVVAFANCAGGRLIFGVDDKTHETVGLDPEDLQTKQDAVTNAICDKCEPRIPFEIYPSSNNGKTVLIVDVAKGNRKPYYLKSRGRQSGTYVRIGATSRPADLWQLEQLNFDNRSLSFDERPTDRKVSEAEIESLCERLYLHAKSLAQTDDEKARLRRIGLSQLLSYRVISQEGNSFYATTAFELLSGNLQNNPDTIIRCAVFRSTDRSFLVTARDIEGPIDEQIEDAYSFAVANLHLGLRIEGIGRRQFLEIPENAIREMIANAVCHRSYLYPEPIRVIIYADRFEVRSPGMLVDGLTVAKMREGISKIQNKAIAAVFRYMGVIESWGSGIPKILSACRAYGLDEPALYEDDTDFVISINRKPFERDAHGDIVPHRKTIEAQTTPSGFQDMLTSFDGQECLSSGANRNVPEIHQDFLLRPKQRQILEYLTANPFATQAELSEHLGIPIATVKRYTGILQTLGLLVRKGSRKTGHWELSREVRAQLSDI